MKLHLTSPIKLYKFQLDDYYRFRDLLNEFDKRNIGSCYKPKHGTLSSGEVELEELEEVDCEGNFQMFALRVQGGLVNFNFSDPVRFLGSSELRVRKRVVRYLPLESQTHCITIHNCICLPIKIKLTNLIFDSSRRIKLYKWVGKYC